jgi:hypothetical protein
MDLFIILFGKENHSRELKSAVTASIPLKRERILLLNKQYSFPFWLHLAITLHSINQKVVYPLGMFTLLLEFRGLSRIGRAISHFVGVAPTVRTVDKIKQHLLKLQAFEIQDMIKNSICIVTLDNYSHVYGSSSISTSRNTQFLLQNYSVVALVKVPKQIHVNYIQLKSSGKSTFLASLPSSFADLKVYEYEVGFYFSGCLFSHVGPPVDFGRFQNDSSR